MTATAWIALALGVGFVAGRLSVLTKLAKVERERDEAFERGCACGRSESAARRVEQDWFGKREAARA